MVSPPASPLPYAQATAAQHAQALRALQARLRRHFPTLPERSFARVLAEFRPDLLLTPTQIGFLPLDLTQVAQALASAPELPLLDPPLYGQPALALAQHSLHTSELAVQALVELVGQPTGGSQLGALLQRLTTYHPLAEQVVQAWPGAGMCPVVRPCPSGYLVGAPHLAAGPLPIYCGNSPGGSPFGAPAEYYLKHPSRPAAHQLGLATGAEDWDSSGSKLDLRDYSPVK